MQLWVVGKVNVCDNEEKYDEKWKDIVRWMQMP